MPTSRLDNHHYRRIDILVYFCHSLIIDNGKRIRGKKGIPKFYRTDY